MNPARMEAALEKMAELLSMELGLGSISWDAKEWNEQEHPRDEAGKFTDSGGGGGHSGSSAGSGSSGSHTTGTAAYKFADNKIQDIRKTTAKTGKESGALFDSDGKHVKDFNGTKRATNADVTTFPDGSTFVHSHPTNSSFSPDDLVLMQQSKAKSFVVVAPRATFFASKREMGKAYSLKDARNEWQDAALTAHRSTSHATLDEHDLFVSDSASKKLATNMGFDYWRQDQ